MGVLKGDGWVAVVDEWDGCDAHKGAVAALILL
jgi:hypothetical protein